ncbi:hypothetical protein EV421DRAFT_1094168 [Armillaria borealis]|uniref:Rhodanese domain-containing protein n=1 Tax=Armillaria borealis TaxID=47425 RepID=A0AA39J681_9AGAR|nr:hypothetical protein EV421DRAFT_1094168 [Armillaria borealis]
MQAERSSGVVHQEFNDFRPTLNDLISRTKIVEEKLKAVEVQASSAGDGPIHKYGGSLADRLKALRDNGLAVNTTSKRLSLQHSSPVQSPSSPSRAGRHSSSTYPLPNGYSRHASPLLYGTPVINRASVSNSLFPKDLLGLSTGAKLLLIDVRDRADFQRGHIKRGSVICIEPKILRRKRYAHL